jgi:hypothetical protein
MFLAARFIAASSCRSNEAVRLTTTFTPPTRRQREVAVQYCCAIWSSPAIGSDETVYVGAFNDNLYAIGPD